MLNIVARGTWLGCLGHKSPYYLLQKPGWMGFSGTLGLGWDWRSGAGSLASQTFSLPFLRSHIPPVSRLSRRCWGYQGTHLAIRASCFGVLRLREWGAQAERVECHSEEEPHKCLNLSPFLPLLTSDLRVLVFSSSPPVLWVGRGSSWQSLISKAPGLFTSHSQVVVSFRMQSGTSFGYLFYVFYKALHMRGYR